MNVTIGLSRAGFVEVITVVTRWFEHISGWDNIDTQLAKLGSTFREFKVHVSASQSLASAEAFFREHMPLIQGRISIIAVEP